MTAGENGELSAEELRRRLDEAEETLRAIREGEVDALVMRGLKQDEVFTLEGGIESYRAFMEAMDLGAAALDGEHRVLYANGALCSLLDRRADELLEAGLYAVFEPDVAEKVRKAVTQVQGAGKQSVEIRIPKNGGECNLLVTASPLQLGLTSGIAVTFTDLTERVRAATAEESERMAHAVLGSANEAVVVCDTDGIITHANAAVRAICEGDPAGRKFDDAIPLIFTEESALLREDDFVTLAIAGTSVQGIEASAPQAPRVKDLLVSAAPLVVQGERIRGCVVTLVDLTQRKAAERQQALLMRELDHRVKNTLALVVAICTRTASNEDTVDGFQRAFVERIHGLAATHTLLAEKSWTDLMVGDVIVAELKPFIDAAGGRIALEGLNVSVTPRAAIALGLVFHELTTNAVKYGSLSNDTGRLSVRAALVDGEEPFTIAWEETGGPEVGPPSKKGFGQTVIARSLSYAPGGGTDIDYRAEGLLCTIRIPREDVVAG